MFIICKIHAYALIMLFIKVWEKLEVDEHNHMSYIKLLSQHIDRCAEN